MSVQFGRWNTDGQCATPEELEKIDTLLAPYGPDGKNCFSAGGVAILRRHFHTTKESRRELQPWISKSGVVVSWEGRLDNRQECIAGLGAELEAGTSNSAIVAALYERFGTRCFAKLVGDWALSVWVPEERALVLACDPIGTHRLYYSIDAGEVRWSSVLAPLIECAESEFTFDEEYLAGWLAFFPDPQITPYKEIRAVPPSCFIRIEGGRNAIYHFWDFDPGQRVRYRADADYEEHFRCVFAQAVHRRLNSDAPVLAELSGGMDSSSIVCMADAITSWGITETPRVDTLSYYSDSEPNWNERPFFETVERKRGRCGRHIRVEPEDSFQLERDSDDLAWTPSSHGGRASSANREFSQLVDAGGYRVVLSGTGGDEVTGGVPTSTPELADLLAAGDFRRLAQQLNAWAINKRKPWFHLLRDAAREFVPPSLLRTPPFAAPAPWIRPDFCSRNGTALRGYPRQFRWRGSRPSFQQNQATLDSLRRQLACRPVSWNPHYEVRYPFLDRDLLEFLFAVPREQLLRPGQRRSLLRRAMAGTVPDEILNRRRKAFVARAPLMALATHWDTVVSLTDKMIIASLGFVDEGALLRVIEQGVHGHEVPMVPLLRTLRLELWLRSLDHHRLLARGTSPGVCHLSPPRRANRASAPACMETVRPAETHANRERKEVN